MVFHSLGIYTHHIQTEPDDENNIYTFIICSPVCVCAFMTMGNVWKIGKTESLFISVITLYT